MFNIFQRLFGNKIPPAALDYLEQDSFAREIAGRLHSLDRAINFHGQKGENLWTKGDFTFQASDEEIKEALGYLVDTGLLEQITARGSIIRYAFRPEYRTLNDKGELDPNPKFRAALADPLRQYGVIDELLLTTVQIDKPIDFPSLAKGFAEQQGLEFVEHEFLFLEDGREFLSENPSGALYSSNNYGHYLLAYKDLSVICMVFLRNSAGYFMSPPDSDSYDFFQHAVPSLKKSRPTPIGLRYRLPRIVLGGIFSDSLYVMHDFHI